MVTKHRLYMSKFMGAILMYVGFLQAIVVVSLKAPAPVAAANNKA